MPYNILYVIRPVAGGMREHLVLLIKHLDRDRFIPHAIIPTDDLLAGKIRDLGVEPHIVNSIGSLSARSVVKSALAVRAIAKAVKASLVHSHGYRTALSGGIGGKSAGLPHVVSIHTELGGRARPGIAGRLMQSVVGLLSDRIVVVSESITGSFPRGKTRIVENGVELPPFPKAGEAKNRIGYMGRLAPEKGVDLFLEAARRLLDVNDSLRFVVVGEGPLMAGLMEQARRLGIAEAVEFPGFVDEAKKLLSSFDVLVLPSRSEGQPMIVLEAFAAGCPVVATDVGGVADLLSGGCGRLVKANDAQAIAEAVEKLLAEPKALDKIRTQARRKVEEAYSAGKMAERTMDVYREVLG